VPRPTGVVVPTCPKPGLTAGEWRAKLETIETNTVSEGSKRPRAEVIVDAAGRLFLAPGPGRVSMDDLARELGMSKKTIYRHFPDKHSLLTAVLDRQFAAVERTLVAAAEDSADQSFGERIQRFLIAACGEFARIGAAQLATGRGDAVLRRHVEQRIDTVVYQRLDELFRDGHRQGLLSAPPELLGEITRGAVERLLNSQLPRELNCTAADLLRATVDTVLHGAIRPGGEGEQEVGS
jgi:AcrR family transcriptional regulator